MFIVILAGDENKSWNIPTVLIWASRQTKFIKMYIIFAAMGCNLAHRILKHRRDIALVEETNYVCKTEKSERQSMGSKADSIAVILLEVPEEL